MKDKQLLAIWGGNPTVTVPRPHFSWGSPTVAQVSALEDYIACSGSLSIYGDDGIYRELEREIESRYQTDYCILTNTGTSALSSAFFGIGLERGDEVIVPTYTFLSTVTPLLRIGAMPIFADGNAETGNIDPADVLRRIGPRTKAVVVTHMWGVPCEMDAISAICKKHQLKLVEDCSHAHFTSLGGQLCGTFGDAACFSIGAKKTWTSGEGGFLITKNPEVFARATLLGHFEVRAKEALQRLREDGYKETAEKYAPYTIGFGENYRMHPYSAVMAKAFLDQDFDDALRRRRESLQYFREVLMDLPGIEPPLVSEAYFTGAMYGFKAKFRPKDVGFEGENQTLINALRAENVEVKLPDSGLLHVEPLFRQLQDESMSRSRRSSLSEEFPGATEYLRGRVSLPTFSKGLANDRKTIDQYAEAIKKVMLNARMLK